MKKSVILIACAVIMLCASCVSTKKTMPSAMPEIKVELKDLEISERMEAKATTVKVFGIDWSRLFSDETGAIRGSLYGLTPGVDKTDLYALYALMRQNEDYDIVMYPQFNEVVSKPFLGLGAIVTITDVKVSARMAKLREQSKTK